MRYLQMTDPELLGRGRYPSLEALSARSEVRPEIKATYPADVRVPRGA